MLLPSIFILGLATVLCYNIADGYLLEPETVSHRITRSVSQWGPNAGMASPMAINHMMNNVRARHWRPAFIRGNNNNMQSMQTLRSWIPHIYTVPFNTPSMHNVGRSFSQRQPFQQAFIHLSRLPFYMFPRRPDHSFPNTNMHWQSPRMLHNAMLQNMMMHWNPINMQRFPMVTGHGFGNGFIGRGGIQSSTEASAGKGPKGATPFDDRK